MEDAPLMPPRTKEVKEKEPALPAVRPLIAVNSDLVVPKGSVTIDGISLTVARSILCPFPTIEIAVIPYTYEHTNICDHKPGDAVNLEGDVLGKYIERHLEARKSGGAKSGFTLEGLKDQGF